MNENKLNEAIKYNLDYLEGNYSIEEDLEETYKCLKETQQELDQYKNNWEELKKYVDGTITDTILVARKDVLNKMKELEEDK